MVRLRIALAAGGLSLTPSGQSRAQSQPSKPKRSSLSKVKSAAKGDVLQAADGEDDEDEDDDEGSGAEDDLDEDDEPAGEGSTNRNVKARVDDSQ